MARRNPGLLKLKMKVVEKKKERFPERSRKFCKMFNKILKHSVEYSGLIPEYSKGHSRSVQNSLVNTS